METVLDALKVMKKASYREIAARLDIEPVTALTLLREQKEQGLCDFADGGWFLGTATEQKPKRIRPKVTSPLVGDVLAALQGQGAMSAGHIAEKLGKTSRALNATLGAMSKDGQVVRHVDGKNITWSLPGETAPAQPEPAAKVTEPAPVSKSTAEIVQDIPVFTARADDLVIPSSRFISGEIRRTKAKLAGLQKLQGAVRELRRHKHLLVGRRNAELNSTMERWAVDRAQSASELDEAEKRISELESQRQMAFMASNRWADKYRDAEKRIAELSHHLQCAHAFIEHTEAFGHEASNGILCCGDAQWNIDESKSVLAAAGKGE